MFLTAWLIGDGSESVLDGLTAEGGYPTAEVWVSLDSIRAGHVSRLPTHRSAWATRTANGQEWVDFAIPAQTVIHDVGRHALIDPGTLAYGCALATNIEERDGALMVKVPRYFTTVGTAWTYQPLGPESLITMCGQPRVWTTVKHLNVRASMSRHPDLLIEACGPRRLSPRSESHRPDYYYNAAGRTPQSSIERELGLLHPNTVIRCAWITPHGTEVWL